MFLNFRQKKTCLTTGQALEQFLLNEEGLIKIILSPFLPDAKHW